MAGGGRPARTQASEASVRWFETLFQAHSRSILAYAVRRTGNHADAEDVMIETFAACWRRLDEAPVDERARLWLYGLASGVIANQLRAMGRRRRLQERIGSLAVAEARSAAHDPAHEQLDLAMQRLRPSDRELLRLAVWEGLAPAELAVVLGCSVNAATIRLHRSRRALSEAFHAIGCGGPPERTDR